MPFENSAGLGLIPQFSPPHSYTRYIPAFVARSLSTYAEQHRRTVQWTVALAVALQERYQDYPIGQWSLGREIFPTIGFLDPDHEANAFGVIIHHSVEGGLVDQTASRSYFEQSLTIEGQEFPVVRRYSSLLLEASQLHPSGGRGTCMARRRRRKKGREKWIVTAEHVVKGSDNVDIYDGHGSFVEQGAVDTLASSGIDAATIRVASGSVGNRMVTMNPVAPWMDVELYTKRGIRSGKVVSVSDIRGSLSPLLPARVFISVYGRPGDSGAAVVEKGTRSKLVGIYLGAMTTATGATEGVCQHAAQAEADLGVDFFLGV